MSEFDAKGGSSLGEARSVRKSKLPPELNALTEQIIAAAMEVHRALGPGYAESVYEHALAIELSLRQIQYSRQHATEVTYKGVRVGEQRLDFVVADAVVL